MNYYYQVTYLHANGKPWKGFMYRLRNVENPEQDTEMNEFLLRVIKEDIRFYEITILVQAKD